MKKVEIKKYWDFSELLGKNVLSFKSSIDALDNALNRTILSIVEGKKIIGVSLTGGWDGRLLLAYVMKHRKPSEYFLYSFGTKGFNDIVIPQEISATLDLNYFPYFLDDNYVANFGLQSIHETITSSGGTRNYLRSHYYYAMLQNSKRSSYILSGNCASNILKFGKLTPSTVMPIATYEWILRDLSFAVIQNRIEQYNNLLNLETKDVDELMQRLIPFTDVLKHLQNNKSYFYFYFLLMHLERKYFGAELSSYNDLVHNFSPFIDFNFIKTLSETKIWGANYNFNKNSYKLRKFNIALYPLLIKRNSPELLDFITDRGIKMRRLGRIDGQVYLVLQKFKRKFQKKAISYYNSWSIEDQFNKLYNRQDIYNTGLKGNMKANYLSTQYFKQILLEKD